MDQNSHTYLTLGIAVGLSAGAGIGSLLWVWIDSLFCIPLGASFGMLIGIVAGSVMDWQKNNRT